MSAYDNQMPMGSGLANNESNHDHALNCPCKVCKNDPVRQAALAEALEAQKRKDQPT
jgi:hypothetical protein